MTLMYVGIGTALGAVARLITTSKLNQAFQQQKFPWATFIVNMLACLLIGILTAYLHDPKLKLLLVSGFLGGLSTFSTFANELVILYHQENKKLALLYCCASLFIGLLLVDLGMHLYALV